MQSTLIPISTSNKHKDKKIIFSQINELFNEIFRLKRQEEFVNFLKFLRRVPNYAPFNSALVFAQKPDCFYYASKEHWKKFFNREVKPGAKPLLILVPFGPVKFVYDLSETEGDPITEEKLLYWWKERKGEIDAKVFNKTIKRLDSYGIRVEIGDLDYIKKVDSKTLGYALEKSGSREIGLHPRYRKFYGITEMTEKYAVLVHEIAHHFLGHLGGYRVKKKNRVILKIEDRRGLEKSQKEIEAELTTWIVMNHFGVNSDSSITYLAFWINKKMSEIKTSIDFSFIFTTAKRIIDLAS